MTMTPTGATSDSSVPTIDSAVTVLEQATSGWPPWAVAAAALLGAVALASILLEILLLVAVKTARRTPFAGDELLARRLRAPLRAGVPLLVALLMRPALALPAVADEVVRRLLAIALIGVVTWFVIRVIHAGARILLERHRTDVADNLRARRIHTQLRIIARIAAVVAGLVGAAAMLMTFPSVRQIGTSLLASAGIAGIIIGLAAQKTIGNLIAGLQIALTGPIHLDDVVIIDGEWGRIEEITSTYVVVRIWDERRLIVPFSRIIDQSFENWTRRTADILGTVFLHADYSVPVDAVRKEVRRLAEASDDWDGRVAELVVTDAGARTVQLRALVSAADASRAWKLRCAVREGLIEFLQRHHPDCLPRVRAALEQEGRSGLPAPIGAGRAVHSEQDAS